MGVRSSVEASQFLRTKSVVGEPPMFDTHAHPSGTATEQKGKSLFCDRIPADLASEHGVQQCW